MHSRLIKIRYTVELFPGTRFILFNILKWDRSLVQLIRNYIVIVFLVEQEDRSKHSLCRIKVNNLFVSMKTLKKRISYEKIILNQIIECLNQIISENKPYNLRVCTFAFHKFQEKNLNLNWDSNSDLQISSLALYHGGNLILLPIHLQTLLLKLEEEPG